MVANMALPTPLSDFGPAILALPAVIQAVILYLPTCIHSNVPRSPTDIPPGFPQLPTFIPLDIHPLPPAINPLLLIYLPLFLLLWLTWPLLFLEPFQYNHYVSFSNPRKIMQIF